MLTAIAGLVAGMAHVLGGPDHLAALAPFSVERPRSAWWVGATWGLGHGSGVVLLGVMAQLVREGLDLDRLTAWSEVLVGIVLVALGIWALWKSRRVVVHSHPHEHGDMRHDHLHIHDRGDHGQSGAHRHHRTVFGVGMLHGAAGMGHLFGVLPSVAMTRVEATTYLAAYLVAAVLAMAAFASLLGWIAARMGQKRVRSLMAGAGVTAIAVGGVWIALGGGWPR